MTRGVKKSVIIIIYFIIFSLVAYLIYLAIRPAPTCHDGKKNQKEEKADCGGPCAPCEKIINAQPLEIAEKGFAYGGPGKYDMLAKITNPNNQFGSSKFSYEFTLRDSEGREIARRNGEEFILPAETKYILETGIETGIIPQEAEIKITSTSWEEFFEYEKPKLNIYNKRYNLISGDVGYSEAYGLVRNENPFDFNFIKINVVLRDASGKILALNSTDMHTVSAGEQRDFRLIWPTSFPGDVENLEMEAEADVFHSQNFIKKYLPGGKFQELQ